MGLMKREIERLSHLSHSARHAAVKTGALVACPVHEDELIDAMDLGALEEARALGTKEWEKGEIDGDLDEYLATIDKVVGEGAMECGYCSKD